METQPQNVRDITAQLEKRVERLVSYAQGKIDRKLKRKNDRLLQRDGMILVPIRDYVTLLFYLSEKSKKQNLMGLIYEAEKRVVKRYQEAGWNVNMHVLHIFNVGFQGQYEFRLKGEYTL